MKDIKLPLAIDSNGESSVTLLFAYAAFVLAVLACVHLLSTDAVAGTISSLLLFFGSLAFYRLRSLDKVKFSLKDQSFELEDVADDAKV